MWDRVESSGNALREIGLKFLNALRESCLK